MRQRKNGKQAGVARKGVVRLFAKSSKITDCVFCSLESLVIPKPYIDLSKIKIPCPVCNATPRKAHPSFTSSLLKKKEKYYFA